MKQFFYRMSWDKDFKKNFFKYFFIGSFCVVVLSGIGIFAYGNLVHNDEDVYDHVKIQEADEEHETYNIAFDGKHEENKDESNKEKSDNNTNSPKTESNTQENNNFSSSDSGNNNPQHTHSWHVVWDQQPYDEISYIQVGTKYICNQCGYSCTDGGTANMHTRATGHSFRTEPIMGQRKIHHDGRCHEECSCGARR